MRGGITLFIDGNIEESILKPCYHEARSGAAAGCLYHEFAAGDTNPGRFCWQIAQDSNDLLFRYNVCLDCIFYVLAETGTA